MMQKRKHEIGLVSRKEPLVAVEAAHQPHPEDGPANPPRERARCGGTGGGGAAQESKTALRTPSGPGALPSKSMHALADNPGTAFCGQRRSKA